MRTSILVGTYGSDEWRDLGDVAFAGAVRDHDDACEHRRLHLPGGTLAEVRNELARNATGDYLCFVDADDWLTPGYLDAMATARAATYISRDPWQCLFVPAVEYVRDDLGSVLTSLGPPRIPAWDRPLIEVNCAVIGTVVPRDLFFRAGGFRELESLEDWDLTLRAVRAGARLVAVPDAVYVATVAPYGRNADQSPYAAIRAEHGSRFPWHDVGRYKVAL